MNYRHPVCYFLKIILGCRFSFEAYAKNVREKATIVLFRNYWGSVHMFLSKFHINPGTIAPSCFKSHTNSWYFVFFSKKSLPDVRSEIHLGRRDVISTRQSVRAFLKKYIQAWYVFVLLHNFYIYFFLISL